MQKKVNAIDHHKQNAKAFIGTDSTFSKHEFSKKSDFLPPNRASSSKYTRPVSDNAKRIEKKDNLNSSDPKENLVQNFQTELKDGDSNIVGKSNSKKTLVQELREELKKAYVLLDAAKAREDQFREKILYLQQQISEVKQVIEFSASSNKEMLNNSNSFFVTGSQEYSKKIKQLEEMIQKVQLTNQFLKEDRDRLDSENIQLRQALKETEKRVLKLAKAKSRLERELVELKNKTKIFEKKALENGNEDISTTTDKDFQERLIQPDSRASTVKEYNYRKDCKECKRIDP